MRTLPRISGCLILLITFCHITLQAQSSQAVLIEAMKRRLVPEEKEMLQSIYAPTVVGGRYIPIDIFSMVVAVIVIVWLAYCLLHLRNFYKFQITSQDCQNPA